MRYVIVTDRPDGMTGRAYLREIVDGVPWTTPFEDEAAKMGHGQALRALQAVTRAFQGYRVEPCTE
jgi:hypothetical protein